jgi:anti-sigma B factor antagonist
VLTDDEASFNLELDTSGPGPLVRVHGDLDLETAPELTGLLKTLLGPHPVVVDLTDVEFMDSSGLGVLVGAHKESIAHSGALVVVGPQPRIQKILRITKLDKVFTVYPTLDDFSAVLAEQQLAEAAENSPAAPAGQPSGQAQTPASPQTPRSSRESGLSLSDAPQAPASGGSGASSVVGSSRDGGPPGRDGGRG